jgi:hypothetical protein
MIAGEAVRCAFDSPKDKVQSREIAEQQGEIESS